TLSIKDWWDDEFAIFIQGSLKKLFVEGMPKVVTIAPELFPSLLELKDMQGWENWSVNNDNSDGSTILFHVFLRFL
ncbi:hypothetical protein Tco_1373675, partial [Tanacetum coccineum]